MSESKYKERRLIGVLPVGAYVVSVYLVPGLRDADNTLGEFDSKEHTIVLDETLEGVELMDTFFHEVMEAINYYADLDMPHSHIQVCGLLMGQMLEGFLGFNKLTLK